MTHQIHHASDWGNPLFRAAAAYGLLLSGVSILRPIRDSMMAELTETNVPKVMLLTFAVTLAAAPLFALLGRSLQPRKAALTSYLGIVILIALGAAAHVRSAGEAGALILLISISAGSLFIVGIFWAALGGTENRCGRLSLIASAGTAGSLAGSCAVICLAQAGLFAPIIAATASFVGSALVHPGWSVSESAESDPAPETKSLFAVMTFILFTYAAGTFLYFDQLPILAARLPESGDKLRFLAAADIGCAVLLLFAGRFLRRNLTAGTAAILLAGSSILLILDSAQAILFLTLIARRAAEQGGVRPLRELAHLKLAGGEVRRNRAPFDAVLARGGDALSAGLTLFLGTGLAVVGCVVASAAMLASALRLQRQLQHRDLR